MVSIRGRILTGKVVSTKMHRTLIIRREYLHFIPKYARYEKRHSNLAAHVSPAFRVDEGDTVTVGQCRPLSKTVSTSLSFSGCITFEGFYLGFSPARGLARKGENDVAKRGVDLRIRAQRERSCESGTEETDKIYKKGATLTDRKSGTIQRYQGPAKDRQGSQAIHKILSR
jgi:ribosomal protein S17